MESFQPEASSSTTWKGRNASTDVCSTKYIYISESSTVRATEENTTLAVSHYRMH